ncbi:succinate-semialdehyde dehydrogenase (NADP+) [Fusarium circinatum]|uniref:succinate-semialdehyde dehydrogenase [NAD(P)(+)] n=1 Tax=Fusarium circinatum TaxID=48490 RepID=A0A8H5UCK4_FUSCI|nr:succinate-semialdehyde dehydrogenase (NADP+) [Fusarium circinatum]
MSSLASTLKDPSLLVESRPFINGEWPTFATSQAFPVYNPATNTIIGLAPECTVDDVNSAISAASEAFPLWRAQSGRQRAEIIRKIAELVVEHKSDIAKIITAENGKAKADAEGEVMFSAGFFEWFAEEAPRLCGDVVPHSQPNSRIQVIKQPVGVCGLITPWNFPLAMAARKVAAALAAGCTVVLKTDGVTPFSGNVLGVLAERAGLPKGVLNIVTALDNTPKLGLALCESDVVKKISFTGSTRVGKILMKQSADTLKKLSLELGGNAPFIVFDDADLETAVSSAIIAKFKVTGQTCVCANRIYVQEGIYDQFSERLIEEVGQFKVGNGADPSVTHGPMTTSVDKVEEHVKDALKKKATLLLGGQRLPDLGKNFFQPTVLGDVDDTMAVTYEETFGPLAALTRFKTEDEVIARANKSDVGLASYIMTNNLARSYRVQERLEFGMVAINTGVISDWAAPFGGVKHSGMGREGSKYGVDDYMVLKTIVTGGINTVISILKSAKSHRLLSQTSFPQPSYRHKKTKNVTTSSDMATDKMKSSPLKPSTPIAIPPGRNRAFTIDQLPQHHPPSRRSILPGTPSPQGCTDTAPPDPRKTVNPEDPLRYVDSLKLQVVRNQRGETLGLKVVDINSVKPERANICAHLHIGKENSGLVFDVDSPEAMKELYSKASLTMASDRIMGILFAPPGAEAGGIARDADWSFLDGDVGGREAKEENLKEENVKESRDQGRSDAHTLLPLHLRDLHLKD